MREDEKERKREIMKVFKKLLFATAMVVGLSVAAFAQKDDQKKPPPKENPPVVTPQPKDPPPKPPSDDKKPKKPSTFEFWRNEE